MKTASLGHLDNNVTPFKKKGSSLIPQMPVLPSGGVGSLESYISAVNQMPMLTAAEEVEFAKKLQNENDLESARRLILSHLRLVVSVSRQYLGYGLPHADLIQEGNIGLMKAVKRFDVNQGVRLVSYAIFWIKAEIHEFILKNWRLVRVATTKPQRKLFFNLRSNKPTLNALSTEEVRDLALALDVNQHDVREMEIRLSGADVTLEPENDDGEAREQGSWMSDSSLEPTQVLMKQEEMNVELDGLQAALSSLDDRSRRIIESRWLPNIVGGTALTLHDLADELQISAERVRQIEATALKKMRAALGA